MNNQQKAALYHEAERKIKAAIEERNAAISRAYETCDQQVDQLREEQQQVVKDILLGLFTPIQGKYHRQKQEEDSYNGLPEVETVTRYYLKDGEPHFTRIEHNISYDTFEVESESITEYNLQEHLNSFRGGTKEDFDRLKAHFLASHSF